MGSLIFSIVETCLDIAFIMSIMSRFAKHLSRQYIEVMKTVMQYFKASHTLGIIYKRDKGDLGIGKFADFD